MDGPPRVFPSGARVATVDGIEVHLTLETWGDRIAVRLVGAASARTRQLTAEYETAMQEWAEHRSSHPVPRPPRDASR